MLEDPAGVAAELPPSVATAAMKQKLAKSHENRMVRQRKVPNCEKKTRLQRNSGNEANTEVIMPLKTGEPISLRMSADVNTHAAEGIQRKNTACKKTDPTH